MCWQLRLLFVANAKRLERTRLACRERVQRRSPTWRGSAVIAGKYARQRVASLRWQTASETRALQSLQSELAGQRLSFMVIMTGEVCQNCILRPSLTQFCDNLRIAGYFIILTASYSQNLNRNFKNDPRNLENSGLRRILSGKIRPVFDNLEAKNGDRRKRYCKSFRIDRLGRVDFYWTLKYLVH